MMVKTGAFSRQAMNLLGKRDIETPSLTQKVQRRQIYQNGRLRETPNIFLRLGYILLSVNATGGIFVIAVVILKRWAHCRVA